MKKGRRACRAAGLVCVMLIRRQAALSHIAVSKALLIIGMFTPKFGLPPVLLRATLVAGLTAALVGAVSVARSHDPLSWERATEKNRST